MRTFALALVASLSLAGCKSKEAPPSPTPSASTSPSAAAPAAPAEAIADHITVFAEHAQRKPTDPVSVTFERFSVKAAKFDATNLEGGTASIEIDLASLATSSAKRDEHLRGDGYLDVSKYATATIDVSNVKRQSPTRYSADARVALHGADKTYPVTFDVIEAKAGAVRVRGEAAISRLDFDVGRPAGDPDESVAVPLKVELVLTLSPT